MRISDWSSDVCSSDLPARRRAPRTRWRTPMTTIDDPPPATGPTEARTESAVALAGRIVHEVERAVIGKRDVVDLVLASVRSEERRVGKGGVSKGRFRRTAVR